MFEIFYNYCPPPPPTVPLKPLICDKALHFLFMAKVWTRAGAPLIFPNSGAPSGGQQVQERRQLNIIEFSF